MKHYFSRAALLLLSVATVFSFTACGGDDEDVTPSQDQEQVQPSDGIVHVEQLLLQDARQTIILVLDDETKRTYQIKANLYPENVSDKNVTILSSDPDVVSVNGDIVTAHNAGVAVVEVTTRDGGFSDFINFMVLNTESDIDPERPFGIYGFENGETVELSVGESLPLIFWVNNESDKYKDCKITDIKYKDNYNKEIISVSKSGEITALAAGRTVIEFVIPKFDYYPFTLYIDVSDSEEPMPDPTPGAMTEEEARSLFTKCIWMYEDGYNGSMYETEYWFNLGGGIVSLRYTNNKSEQIDESWGEITDDQWGIIIDNENGDYSSGAIRVGGIIIAHYEIRSDEEILLFIDDVDEPIFLHPEFGL